MKIVGLSGAQGAGKSTVLNELKARGWRVDDFKVSRAVQKEFGWDSLQNVMESPETMMKFQNEVLRQKLNHDFALGAAPDSDKRFPVPEIKSNDSRDRVILTERTFADVYAYTSQWTWRFVDDGRMTLGEALKFLKDFTDRCATSQKTCYARTILLPFMKHIAWEDDKNRASFKDVETVYEDCERFIERMLPVNHRRHVILGKTVSQRADEIESFLETI